MNIRGFLPVAILTLAVGISAVFASSTRSRAQISEVKQTDAGYSDKEGYYVDLALSGESKSYTAYLIVGEEEKAIGTEFSESSLHLTNLDAGKSYTIRIYDDAKHSKDVVVKTTPAATTPFISSWLYNTNKFWVTYTKTSGAEGYELLVEKKNTKKLLSKTIKADQNSSLMHSIDISKLYGGSVNRLRMRGYITISGQKKYGAWSDPYYFAAPTKAAISSHDFKITLTGLKVSGATKKVVYISNKKNKGYKKVATLGKKKTKCTISKYNGSELKSSKTYYVKVYYYYKVGGKEQKSPIVGNIDTTGIGISKYGVKVGPLTLAQSVTNK